MTPYCCWRSLRVHEVNALILEYYNWLRWTEFQICSLNHLNSFVWWNLEVFIRENSAFVTIGWILSSIWLSLAVVAVGSVGHMAKAGLYLNKGAVGSPGGYTTCPCLDPWNWTFATNGSTTSYSGCANPSGDKLVSCAVGLCIWAVIDN